MRTIVVHMTIGLKMGIVLYIRMYGDDPRIDGLNDILLGIIIVNGEWIHYIEFIKMILMIILKTD
jgi:hypothetical protein